MKKILKLTFLTLAIAAFCSTSFACANQCPSAGGACQYCCDGFWKNFSDDINSIDPRCYMNDTSDNNCPVSGGYFCYS